MFAVKFTAAPIFLTAVFLILFLIGAANQTASGQTNQEKFEQANILFNEGWQLVKQNTADSLQASIPKLEQARRIFHELNKQQSEAVCLFAFGFVASSLGNNQKALEYYNQALPVFHALQDGNDEAAALYRIGSVYENSGEKQKALEYYAQALPVYRSAGDKTSEAAMFNEIGSVYDGLGEKQKALEYYNQALLLRRALGDKQQEGRMLNNIGRVYDDLGDKQKALEYLTQSLSIARSVGDKTQEARTLNNIGLVYDSLGEKQKALEYYSQSLPLLHSAGDKQGEALILNNIGLAYDNLGEKQKALEYYNQTLPLIRAVGDKQQEGKTLSNIGLIYNSLGENRKALEYLMQSLPLIRAVGDKHTEAAILSNLGLAYDNSGEKQKALDYYSQALRLVRITGDKRTAARILNNIGAVYGSLNEKQKELEYDSQALPVVRAAGDKEGEAATLNNMFYALTVSNPRFGVFYGKLSVNNYQRLRSNIAGLDKNTQQTFLKSVEDVYRRLADALIAQTRVAEALQVLNAFKDQQFFDFNLKLPLASLAFTAREAELVSILDRQIERVGKIDSQVAELRRQNAPAAEIKTSENALQQAQDDYTAFLKSSAAEFAAAPTEKDKSPVIEDCVKMQTALRELSSGTGEKTVAVYTLVGDTRFSALIVTENDISVVSNPIIAADVNSKALLFHTALKTVWNGDETADKRLWGKPKYDAQAPAKDLYDAAFARIVAKLPKDTKTVLWSLDGTLRYIPVTALFDGEKYLVELFQNVIFTRADASRLLRNVAAARTGTGFGSSKPHTIDLNGRQLRAGALPGVKTELDSIFGASAGENRLPGEVLLDDNFTRSAIVSALSKRRPLVLIASHFRFLPGDEANSFLLLGDGSPFTLDEMKNENELFAGVDLLTLSACETAAQQADANGREIDGFAELAQRLGAGAVLASLWEVSDKSTSELMTRFYRAYNPQKGMNKAAALRASQFALLHGDYNTTDIAQRVITQDEKPTGSRVNTSTLKLFTVDEKKRFAHPFYWSPFILIGNIK